MKSLHCLVYVSSATRLLAEEDLETMLADARSFNELQGVTGVLLYNEGNFFQYLEGALDHLEQVYQRIRNSRQHRNIIELLKMEVRERLFAEWSMGFFQPPRSQQLNLANAQWWAASPSQLANPGWDASPGMGLLKMFCATARRI